MRRSLPTWRKAVSLTVFTSPTCTLCEPTKFVCRKVGNDANKKYGRLVVDYSEVDITSSDNIKWKELYEYKIPVVHINSTKFWSASINENKLSEKKLKHTLEERYYFAIRAMSTPVMQGKKEKKSDNRER